MRTLALLSLAVFSYQATAETWSQFRGSLAGQVTAIEHPKSWSESENLAWATAVAGSGWSSPVVVGDRIIITAAKSENLSRPKGMAGGVASMATFRKAKPGPHQFFVACLRLTDGEPIWQRVVGEAVPPVIHPSNTYATESPATDGERVFTFFATTGTLVAWNLDGIELWRRELGTYPAGNGFGTGSSLAVDGQRVFVQFDNDEASFVACFAADTGDQQWRDDRSTKTSWSSPLLWKTGDVVQLVTCGSGVVTSYAPHNGEVLWKLSGMRSGFSGSPAINSKHVFFGNSGPMSAGPLVAVPAETRGTVALDRDFKSDAIAWSRVKSGPGMASPLVAGDYLYITGSGGILNCYNTSTGERVYRERINGMKTVVASLWGDDDHLFILDERGTTHVVRPGSEFEMLGSNSIDDLCWSTPTVSGDTLLVRGVEHLYCIRRPAVASR